MMSAGLMAGRIGTLEEGAGKQSRPFGRASPSCSNAGTEWLTSIKGVNEEA